MTIEFNHNNHDWLVEERNHEVARLRAVIDNPKATETERNVAKDMLDMYIEVNHADSRAV